MSPAKNATLKKLEILSRQAGLKLSKKDLKEIEALYTPLRGQMDELNALNLEETGPEVAFSASWERKE